MLFTSALAYIYSGGATFQHICNFLLVSYYSMVDVPVVHILILYYNYILLLTKQNLKFVHGANNMVIVNK